MRWLNVAKKERAREPRMRSVALHDHDVTTDQKSDLESFLGGFTQWLRSVELHDHDVTTDQHPDLEFFLNSIIPGSGTKNLE
jgi:hypothetical protein